MSPRFHFRRPARWPFWLLLAAWFCANSPQAATYALLTWLGEARHFSHQQRLTAEVAAVLTGAEAPIVFAAVTAAPARPFAPLVAADTTLKKIELAVERTAEVLPPAEREKVRVARAMALPEPRRVAPPHDPPRARLVT